MDANTPLWKAHDISQQLQDKIEVLPNVERAFVHVDHETTHIPVGSSPVFLSSSYHVCAGASEVSITIKVGMALATGRINNIAFH